MPKKKKPLRPIRCPRCKLVEAINLSKDPEADYIFEILLFMVPNPDTLAGKEGHNVKCATCQTSFRVDDKAVMIEYFGNKKEIEQSFIKKCSNGV